MIAYATNEWDALIIFVIAVCSTICIVYDIKTTKRRK